MRRGEFRELGGCHSSVQTHAIAGELPIDFMPEFSGLLVTLNLSSRSSKLDGIAEASEQWREVHRVEATAVGEKFWSLRSPEKTVSEPVAGLRISEVFQEFIPGHVPDDADVRARGSGGTVLGEHAQAACIPCLPDYRRERVPVTFRHSQRRGEFRLDDH